jgi:hypothetical protein
VREGVDVAPFAGMPHVGSVVPSGDRQRRHLLQCWRVAEAASGGCPHRNEERAGVSQTGTASHMSGGTDGRWRPALSREASPGADARSDVGKQVARAASTSPATGPRRTIAVPPFRRQGLGRDRRRPARDELTAAVFAVDIAELCTGLARDVDDLDVR